MACNDDFDCNSTLVCYTELNWQEEGESFCGCSTWYGWKSDPESSDPNNCSEFSTSGYIYLAFSALFLIVNGAAFFLFFIELRHFCRIRAVRESNNTTLTLLYSGLSALLFALYGAALIGSLLSPDKHNVSVPGSDEKYGEFGLAERPISILAVGIAVLASTNVSLMWVEVSQRIEHYQKIHNKHVYDYRVVVRLFQLMFVVMVVIAIALGYFYIIYILSIPYLAILLFFYIRGRIKFAGVLEDANLGSKDAKQKEYSKLARRVKRTSNVVIVCIVLFIIFAGLFSFYTYLNWRNFSQPDTISTPPLMLNIALLLMIIWNLAIYSYARATFLRFVESKETTRQASEPGVGSYIPTEGPSYRKGSFEDTRKVSGGGPTKSISI